MAMRIALIANAAGGNGRKSFAGLSLNKIGRLDSKSATYSLFQNQLTARVVDFLFLEPREEALPQQ